MFLLIHERMVRELAADRARLGREHHMRIEDAHRRQVERVRASIELVPTLRPELERQV